MARVIDALLITLGLDSKGVGSGMQEAEKSIANGVDNAAKAVGDGVQKAEQAMTAGIGSVLAFAAPLVGLFAGGKLFGDFVSETGSLGQLSKKLKVNGEDMQAWAGVAKNASGSSDGFYSSLSNLNNKLQQAVMLGGTSAAEFGRLGISVKDAGGNARSALDIMGDLAAKAGSMSERRFTTLASSLGLDKDTITLLRQGSSALDAALARQKELGVYTQKDLETTRKFNIARDELAQSLKAGAAVIMRVVVPAFTFVTEGATKAVLFLRQNEPFVIAFFTGMAAVMTAQMIPAIVATGKAWMRNPMVMAIAKVAAAVAFLALLFDDLWVYAQGGKSALGGLWAVFGTGEEVAAALNGAWEMLKNTGTFLLGILKDYGPQLGKVALAFGGIKAGIMIFTGIKTAVMGVGAAFKIITTIMAANPLGLFLAALALIIVYWKDIQKIAASVGTWLRDGFAAGLGFILDGVKSIADIVSSLVEKLLSFLGLWDSVKDIGGAAKEMVSNAGQKAGEMISSGVSAVGGFFSGISARVFGSPAEGGGVPPAVEAVPVAAREGGGARISSETSLSVGTLNVQTQATDAQGMAQAATGALGDELSRGMVTATNSGVRG